jgi:hypothetical protein
MLLKVESTLGAKENGNIEAIYLFLNMALEVLGSDSSRCPSG